LKSTPGFVPDEKHFPEMANNMPEAVLYVSGLNGIITMIKVEVTA